MVKASASEAVDSGKPDSGLILSRIKSMTLKLVFTASLLDAQHERDSVENEPTCLLVVPLRKALSGIPPSWSDRQMAETTKRVCYSALSAFSR